MQQIYSGSGNAPPVNLYFNICKAGCSWPERLRRDVAHFGKKDIIGQVGAAHHAPAPDPKGYFMERMKKAVLTGAVLALTFAGPALAQSNNCAPRDKVVDRLAAKYGETRQSIGLGTDNAVVEVFASDDTGTWTITVTRTDGMTCLVASGQAFETLVEALPTQGNDA